MHISITGSRCEISCHLISPGAIKRMFCNSHQFHMSISHFQYIVCKTVGNLFIVIKSFRICFTGRMFSPGTRMHFINKHGLFFDIFPASCFHPGTISPPISAKFFHNRSGCRPHFTVNRIRIRLHNGTSILPCDTILISAVFQYTRYK